MSRKRKDVEASTSGIEDPHLSNPKGPTVLTRCSPHQLRSTLDGLDPQQKEVVVELGFGQLLELDCRLLGVDVCLGLVRCVDVVNRSLSVGGRTFPLTATDVYNVLGIPASGTTFQLDARVDELKHGVAKFKGKKTTELKTMLGDHGVGRTFRRALILYTLATFLCPTSKTVPSPKLLNTIVHVKHCSRYNWGALVLDWLFEEIRHFTSDGNKKSLGGCLYFLKIFYFSKWPVGCSVNLDAPLIKQWSNSRIKARVKHERKHKEGLLHALKEEMVNPRWINAKFKHELSQV